MDTAVDEGLTSEEDAVLAEIARENERMLFTLDVGLGDILRYQPGAHPGIIVFRFRPLGPGSINRQVENFVRNQDLAEVVGCVTIVESGNIRIQR